MADILADDFLASKVFLPKNSSPICAAFWKKVAGKPARSSRRWADWRLSVYTKRSEKPFGERNYTSALFFSLMADHIAIVMARRQKYTNAASYIRIFAKNKRQIFWRLALFDPHIPVRGWTHPLGQSSYTIYGLSTCCEWKFFFFLGPEDPIRFEVEEGNVTRLFSHWVAFITWHYTSDVDVLHDYKIELNGEKTSHFHYARTAFE